MILKIQREKYSIICSDPTLYIDNKSRERSGHMTHAMAEFAPGKIIDFNANSCAERYGGHSTFGWVEYRISEDGGETYSDIYELPYSKKAFDEGVYVISVEKAVACDDGRIVAICLRNSAAGLCMPWDTPVTVTSFDGGKTWTEPKELCAYKGRVYDALYRDGIIYVLEFCNGGEDDKAYGWNDEHRYRIFTSHNNGESFEEFCTVPIPTWTRLYGAMLFDDLENLHVYAYNCTDEPNMDHVVSCDGGKTWGEAGVCYLPKGIRNPQVAQMDGIFILHGRNAEFDGADALVLYTSLDGYTWDEGVYVCQAKGCCYYSNNIILRDKDGNNRLLVQYSESYGRELCVDVKHLWVTVEK